MHYAAAPVFLTSEIRQIEQDVLSRSPRPDLMERAGLAAAELRAKPAAGEGQTDSVVRRSRQQRRRCPRGGAPSQAMVVRRRGRLHRRRIETAGRCKGRAQGLAGGWRATVAAIVPPDFRHDLIVDGLFGIGLQRPLEGRYAALINRINTSGSRVLAIDIPSGLHADSGARAGLPSARDHTITFIGLKPGLLTLDGPDHAGEVHVASLGIDLPERSAPGGWLIPESALSPRSAAAPAQFAQGHVRNGRHHRWRPGNGRRGLAGGTGGA